MIRVELCITRSGFYVADAVPDLRVIESRSEAAASQINRRERGSEVREERGKKRERDDDDDDNDERK